VVTNATNYQSYFTFISNSSTIYKFDDTLYQDNAANFSCVITTGRVDFDTLNKKFMSRLSIIADRPSDGSQLLVQWSDNDYQSYNSGISVELDQDLPSITRLGSFRQRNFKLTHTDNTPFRIEELEVDINKGIA